MANWFVSSEAYAAVAQWSANTVYSAGAIVRQLATPTQGNERCFRTTLGGTSGSVEPTWSLSKGAAQPTDNTITDWIEVTGNATYNTPGSWLAPHATLNAAAGYPATGDDILVSSAHSETWAASINIGNFANSTATNPVRVMSVSKATHLLTTGALVATSTAGSGITIANGGFNVYFNGFTFKPANGTSSNLPSISMASNGCVLENCTIDFSGVTSPTGAKIFIGNLTLTEWINVNINWNNANGQIWMNTQTLFVWKGGTNSNAGLCSNFWTQTSGKAYVIYCENVDFSSTGSGKAFIGAENGNVICKYTFVKCKFNSASTFFNDSSTMGYEVVTVGCTNGDGTVFKLERHNGSGVINVDTSTYRNAGVVDNTTHYSYKMVSNSNAKYGFSLNTLPIESWNTLTGAHTVSVKIAGPAGLNTNDVYLEVEYYANATDVLQGIARSTTTFLTGSGIATDSESWTGTVGATYTLSANVNIQNRGYVSAVVKLPKASTTVWVDPQIIIV